MTTERIFKRINLWILLISSIYIIDAFLPHETLSGELLGHYSPYIHGGPGMGSGYKSEQELVLETAEESITVLRKKIIPVQEGEELIMFRTPILGINSKIKLTQSGREAKTTSFLTSWFLILGCAIVISSAITLVSNKKSVIEKAGSLSMILLVVLLAAFIHSFMAPIRVAKSVPEEN